MLNRQQVTDQSRSAITIGILLAASAELLLSTATVSLEVAGIKLDKEAKRAMTNFIESVHKTTYWHNRLTDLVVGNDQNSISILDYVIHNASRFAMIAMHFYNIYNEENPDCVRDAQAAYRVIENLSLKSPSQRFTQEFINRFNSQREPENEEQC